MMFNAPKPLTSVDRIFKDTPWQALKVYANRFEGINGSDGGDGVVRSAGATLRGDGAVRGAGALGTSVSARVVYQAQSHIVMAQFNYHGGSIGRMRVPLLGGPEAARRDRLWEMSCFELFLKPASVGGAYWEVNVAPRGDWAVYGFTAYRSGMETESRVERVEVLEAMFLTDPKSDWQTSIGDDAELAWQYVLSVAIPLRGVPELSGVGGAKDSAAPMGPYLQAGISAVIEEVSPAGTLVSPALAAGGDSSKNRNNDNEEAPNQIPGQKTYWALAHPGPKPDFHHPAGFVLHLDGTITKERIR